MPDFELPWLNVAKSEYGVKEIPGARSNPKIIQWAKDVGGWIPGFYKNDDIPWCGLFVAHCMIDAGIKPGIDNVLSALAWNKFGQKIHPCYGSVMVFKRTGGGHVGLYVSEDKTTYHILGGNQSNMVNVTKVLKSRFVGARWPTEYSKMMPLAGQGVIRKSFDGKISVNEA